MKDAAVITFDLSRAAIKEYVSPQKHYMKILAPYIPNERNGSDPVLGVLDFSIMGKVFVWGIK